jgi:hypothetical protein
MQTPKYPHIEVKLAGEDGNAFAIMGRVARAMRAAGLTKIDIRCFQDEAMRGDYDHLLRTVCETVTVPMDLNDDRSEEEIDAEWDEFWEEQDASR